MGWEISGLLAIAAILAFLILPVKLAATYVRAKNTGAFMCLVALIFASIIQKGVAVTFPLILILHPVIDSLAALLLSAFAYKIVLGTTYLKGIAVALIQIILTLLLLFIISLFAPDVSEFIYLT